MPQGAWKKVSPLQLKIRQISGGLSNVVFYVGLPAGVLPAGGETGGNVGNIYLRFVRAGAGRGLVATVRRPQCGGLAPVQDDHRDRGLHHAGGENPRTTSSRCLPGR